MFNPFVGWLTSIGISVYGSRVLAVRGRSSGEWRTNPVNLLDYNGARYLVAPRGVTQWVKNIRASGKAELRLGNAEPIHVTEIADADKLDILRAYLKKWAWEVGAFFDGVGADAPESELGALRRIIRSFGSTASSPPPREAFQASNSRSVCSSGGYTPRMLLPSSIFDRMNSSRCSCS